MEYLNAFLCGGILCAVGQIIIDKTQLTPARILTGYVVVGVLLSALGLYEPLAQWGGAGATVPLTGFGHTLAKGVREAVASDGWIGIFTGGLTAAAGGVTAAVVKYRLPNGHSEVPRNDADEALRVMREMAAELNIDPAKVAAAAAFVPAGASNSGFSRLLRTAETTSRPICARPVRLLWRAGFARWVCSSKRVAAATFLRSQGNRCRPVLILSFFCCSFLSGFLLYYGHRQKSTERNIRSCAVLPHCCLPR